MSVMRCNKCEAYVDTDFDLEGVWDDGPPYGYTCTACTERAERDAEDSLESHDANE